MPLLQLGLKTPRVSKTLGVFIPQEISRHSPAMPEEA